MRRDQFTKSKDWSHFNEALSKTTAGTHTTIE
jgi:hypothetical protein